METYWSILGLRKEHWIWPYSTRILFHSRQRNLILSYRSTDDHTRTFKRISIHPSIIDNHPNYHSKSPSLPVNYHPHNHLHTIFASHSITFHLMRNRRFSLNILISFSHLVISFGSTLKISCDMIFTISHLIPYHHISYDIIFTHFSLLCIFSTRCCGN
jgi:hypothetical protein